MSDTANSEFPCCVSCNSCGWSGSSFRVTCPACGGTGVVNIESAGMAEIVDFVPVLYPPENLKDLGRYVSVLVKFQEGFQMFGIMMTDPELISIGTQVEVSSFEKETRKLFFRAV